MTAEQVLRCAILKHYRELTYEELAFHLDDSRLFRSFARLDMGQYPSDSTLQKNIGAIDAETWEAVNRALPRFAAQQDIEKGRTGLWGMPFRPSRPREGFARKRGKFGKNAWLTAIFALIGPD